MKKAIIRQDFEGFDVHKRFDVIIDLLYTGDNFELGGKLNAVFGQYGVSDADAFLDSVNFTFNSMLIDLDETDFSEEKKYDFIFAGLNRINFEEEETKDLNEQSNVEETVETDDNIENINIIEENQDDDENEDNQEEDFDSSNNENFLNELDPEILEQHIIKFNSLAESSFEDNESFSIKNIDVFQNSDECNNFEQIKFEKYLLDNYESSKYKQDNAVNFKHNFEEEQEQEQEQSTPEDISDEEDVITFYVPTILICYRKEKKADFFIFNPFYKRSFVNLWKLNTLSHFAILNNYKDFFFNLKNFYNIKKYVWHLVAFNKQFIGFNFLNSISNYSQIPITDKIFESYYDYDFNMYFMYWSKAKLRRRIFKSYYLRKRKQIASFLKSFKWFSYEILFKFFSLRYIYFDLKVDYNQLKKKVLTLYSIMHAFKKKFARKYRRRKSFKRLVFRNKIGIKMSFIRQQFFEKKKKKK